MSENKQNVSIVLLAAGRGLRYKEVKQDVVFHDKPLWRYPYEKCVALLGKDRVVAVGKDIEGGSTRSGSVHAGLKAVPADTERVVIVEAARPMVTTEQLEEIIEDTHPSTTFVKPLVNSVTWRTGEPVDRELLYDILYPQAFDYKLLLEAYETGKYEDETEDTRVMIAHHGIQPHFIETGSNLYKITYPGDLEFIEAIYRALQEL